MDYGSNAIEIIPDALGPEAWAAAGAVSQNDQAMWATEDDYRAWNAEPVSDHLLNTAYNDRQLLSQSQSKSRDGSEQPPSKKHRSSQGEGNGINKSREIGKMFFKTKLCCKFRAGTCPYVTNCNFAHGMEELRKPPPNWQEIVAAHEGASELREENHIPILTPSNTGAENQRAYKGRHCKKFYTEEGCPYGDACTFLHDEQSKARESVAISLSPTVGGGGYGAGPIPAILKPSNWKTRICNKWEMTGYCPFGSKCHFAHGATELHRYGGGPTEMEGRDASATPDSKQFSVSSKAPTEAAAASAPLVPHADMYHIGVPLQRSTVANHRQGQGQRPFQKWKGQEKITRIYGDWIDDIESA